MAATTMAKLICIALITALMTPSCIDGCEKMKFLERQIEDTKAEIIQTQLYLGGSLAHIAKKLADRSGTPITFPEQPAVAAANCSCPNRPAVAGKPAKPAVPARPQVGGPLESCAEAMDRGLPTGSYTIRLPGSAEGQFIGYCDQDTQDGGWMVIQNRIDETLSFEKNWRHYRKGFGEGDGNYWIGLDKLHLLTANGKYELRVELKNKADVEKYAAYGDFQVGSAAENYKLKSVGAYSGTAGNALYYHVGAGFSTYDTDNDSSGVNCASETKGGWWLFGCQSSHYSNLNGVYDGGSQQGIVWSPFAGYTGLAASRMLIREK